MGPKRGKKGATKTTRKVETQIDLTSSSQLASPGAVSTKIYNQFLDIKMMSCEMS